MTTLRLSGSLIIERGAEDLYDMVADVTRMGEWSPICKACWWDEGYGPEVGSWFTGRNVTVERTWETRSRVSVAERGREFSFVVGGTHVQWRYTFEPIGDATRVTELWDLLPEGVTYFEGRFGDDAPERIAARSEDARLGIPATLAAIKSAAESSQG